MCCTVHGKERRNEECPDSDYLRACFRFARPCARHIIPLLAKLTAINTVQAKVVKLRYFVGMTDVEVAQALGLSERTAKNYRSHARAWLL
jgi:DNA-directed RNA polymerase specialized sigma24 family protein